MLFADGKSGNVRAGRGKRIENISLAENVTEIPDVSRRQVMIEPHAKLIVVGGFVQRGEKRIFASIRQRIIRQQVLRDRIIGERKLVERHRLVGKLVGQLVDGLIRLRIAVFTDTVAIESQLTQLAEISATLVHGGNRGPLRLSGTLAQSFVEEEKESLVLVNWTAQRSAVLVNVSKARRFARKNFLRRRRHCAEIPTTSRGMHSSQHA
jgi:hypothetical protein